MRARIDKNKKKWLVRYEKENRHTIKDLKFKPGEQVLVQNTKIEASLDKKMKPQYMGPMIAITRGKGGSYILAEINGAVLHQKVRAFRVIPYFARKAIELLKNMHELIDVSEEGLRRIKESDNNDTKEKDFTFEGVKLGSEETEQTSEDLSEEEF